ncbi:TonB-dependent receptor plug domain-containing protein [Thiolapillus brandeum]|nr:TonB-dependent receptor [Thiolapillus brandeum]
MLLLLSANVQAENADYLDIPLEELLSMDVTSAARKEQHLRETAASAFIITREDIHRSGVTSIPEALRLAPGVQVARIDANKWAITTRGFNNQFANMLLVMIDGRTVYNPTISGVYWDVQDTMLEDIDRIEVIRGPGATLWGANAVNGVINIITRNASETQGGLLVASAGNEEKANLSLRYGGEIAETAKGRVYMKYTDHDSFWLPEIKQDAGDQWTSLRGGFRIDGTASVHDNWTFQGDIYDADEQQTANYWLDPSDPANEYAAPYYIDLLAKDSIDASGWNLLGRWEHQSDQGPVAALQVYYDHSERSEEFSIQSYDTLDLDFHHRFQPLPKHDVVWGLSYRQVRDKFNDTFMAKVLPDSQRTSLYSFFLQDEIELLPDQLRLIVGSKFEHNDYTGLEVQPTGRLLWLVDSHTTLWGAVSRAVRMPSRVERSTDIVFQIVPSNPPYPPIEVHGYGSNSFDSEILLAYELGLRFQPRNDLSVDLAAYYHDYDQLETLEQQLSPEGMPYLVFDNNLQGDSHGIELSVDWQPREWWRLQLGYSYFDISTYLDAGSSFLGSVAPNGLSTPEHQASLRSLMDISNDLSLDLWIYYSGYIDRPAYLQETSVPGYTSMNIRFAWHPNEDLELSLVGRNLFDKRHLEFVGESYLMPTEIDRSFRAQVIWHF